MKMTSILLALLWTVVARTSNAEAEVATTQPKDLKDWIVVRCPDRADQEEFEKFASRANHSKIEWKIFTDADGKVQAKIRRCMVDNDPKPSFITTVVVGRYKVNKPSLCFQVDDGWLLAFNQGEFGASLFWFDSEGKNSYEISHHHINQFLRHAGRIYAATGLSHLTSTAGEIITLEKNNGKWKADTFVDLKAEACAVSATVAGDFIVVTTGALVCVKKDKNVSTLFQSDLLRWYCYPDSVGIADNHLVYIGMRQFVVRYDLAKNDSSYDLLLPDLSMLNVKSDQDESTQDKNKGHLESTTHSTAASQPCR